jgi:hypothetical protein
MKILHRQVKNTTIINGHRMKNKKEKALEWNGKKKGSIIVSYFREVL